MRFEEKTKNKFKKEEVCGSMIYFLLKNNNVVYVGQSKEGMNRIYFHKFSKKDFDNFCFINCNIKELDELENYYIMKYKPKYNKALNTVKNKLISYTNFYYYKYSFEKAPKLSFQHAKRIIIKNKLYNVKYKNFLYLKINDLDKINEFLTNISLKTIRKEEIK